MLCNRRHGYSAPCFVRSPFGDEALILVIKTSFETLKWIHFYYWRANHRWRTSLRNILASYPASRVHRKPTLHTPHLDFRHTSNASVPWPINKISPEHNIKTAPQAHQTCQSTNARSQNAHTKQQTSKMHSRPYWFWYTPVALTYQHQSIHSIPTPPRSKKSKTNDLCSWIQRGMELFLNPLARVCWCNTSHGKR